jgi:hypothetical protein
MTVIQMVDPNMRRFVSTTTTTISMTNAITTTTIRIFHHRRMFNNIVIHAGIGNGSIVGHAENATVRGWPPTIRNTTHEVYSNHHTNRHLSLIFSKEIMKLE